MLITFSGLDGAGKSTLIAWLKARLEEEHRPVAVFHMTDDIGMYAYLRAVRDWFVRARRDGGGATVRTDRRVVVSTDGGQHATGGQGGARRVGVLRAIVWSKRLRRCIYPLDLATFLLYRLYVEHLTTRVLIMDRYFYDTLVDVADGRSWRWLRWLERITPTPTVPVFLDITPEESYARKGEYTVEYLRKRWVAYREVFRWLPSAVVLTNQDLSATKVALERVVWERVVSR
jgi:hypothetical protein